MHYRVYGQDLNSREPLPPLDIEAKTEEAARAQAAEAGMNVLQVEPLSARPEPPRPPAVTGPTLIPSQPWSRKRLVLCCVALALVSLAGGIVIGSRFLGNTPRGPERPADSKSVTPVGHPPGVRLEEMKSAQEMFALAGQRAVILKYFGGDVEFRVELEARGEKETHGQLLSRFGDDEQPKPGQTVEGYLLWVRSEADSAGFEQWKLANRRDLITTQTSGVQLSTPLVQAKLSQSKEEGQTSSRRSSQPVQVWSGKKHVGNLTLSSGTSLITNPLPTDREVCVKEISEERMQEPSAIAKTGVSLLGLLACSEGGSLLSSSALTCGKTDEIADAYTVRVMCKAVSGKGK